MGDPPLGPPNTNSVYRYKPGIGRKSFFKNDSAFYVIIKNLSDPLNSFKKTSTFLIQKSLCCMVGVQDKSLKIEPLHSGDYIIQLNNEHQISKLKNAEFLHGTDLKILVTDAESANYSKCKVRCPEWDHMTSKEIQEGLIEEKCSNVYRITKKVDDTIQKTPFYILSFKTPYAPEQIFNGCWFIKTEPYVPKPLQCIRCFKINNHTTKNCTVEICEKCKLPSHNGSCESQKCINCKYDSECSHKSNDPKCPEYCYAHEIEFAITMDRITKREARIQINNLILNGSFNGTPLQNILKRIQKSEEPSRLSYSSILQKRIQILKNNSSTNPQNSQKNPNKPKILSNQSNEIPVTLDLTAQYFENTVNNTIPSKKNNNDNNEINKPHKTSKNNKTKISELLNTTETESENDSVMDISETQKNSTQTRKRELSDSSAERSDNSHQLLSKKISKKEKKFEKKQKKILENITNHITNDTLNETTNNSQLIFFN